MCNLRVQSVKGQLYCLSGQLLDVSMATMARGDHYDLDRNSRASIKEFNEERLYFYLCVSFKKLISFSSPAVRPSTKTLTHLVLCYEQQAHADIYSGSGHRARLKMHNKAR